MKTRLWSLLLAAALAVPAMTGCQAARKAAAAGSAVDRGAGYAVNQAVQTPATGTGIDADHALTMEEAERIALAHAGYSADQVTALHTQYEIEHGIPQYDVEFHYGTWEFEYEIHADTGDILSYTKDD